MSEFFEINGGRKLKGMVKISGSKNAALPIMAATLIEKGEYILKNIPEPKDIKTMSDLLVGLGLKIERSEKNTLKITNPGNLKPFASYDLVKTMRASFVVMGPLLTNYNKAIVSLPGGCAIGTRPVNYHIKGFEALGARIKIDRGYVIAETEELVGTMINLDFPSVGATQNIMMAAVKAKGRTIIENAAREPEIEDLANFLIKMGARISGTDIGRIIIDGVERLIPCEYEIIPDRVEAGTLVIASVLTGGEVRFKNVRLDHLDSFRLKLEEMGCRFQEIKGVLKVSGELKKLKPVKITTLPYPGYPTDLQAQIMVLLSLVKGTSEIKETLFENRFMHVPELSRMGADIKTDGNIAIINGVEKLTGAEVMASDLRAGAALVLAGLAAEGKTLVDRIYHIDRGYERLEEKLFSLGAEIKRIGK